MSNYKFLIDAGHGGIDKSGHYVTAPSKMHKFHDGLTIYEGLVNRQIVNRLTKIIDDRYDYELIHDWIDDLSLPVRVARADNAFRKDPRCIFLSVHSNAGGGMGNEIYTSTGQTKSDKVAQIFSMVYQKAFPGFKFRKDLKDGDDDKEAEFYVLRKTDCPALLVENLFFDNRQEAEFLLSEVGQNRFAECLFECIEATDKIKPI